MKRRNNRWVKINNNLAKCRIIALTLKQKNPDQVMELSKDTISVHRKNSRFCDGATMNKVFSLSEYVGMNKKPIFTIYRGRKVFWSTIGHMHNDECYPPFGVCIKQSFLFDPITKNDSKVWIEGNWALIDLVCHELSHFSTRYEHCSHGKAFQKVFQKFIRQMALEVISGNYYTSTNDIELNDMHPDHDVNWINYGNSTTEEEDAFWDTVLAK